MNVIIGIDDTDNLNSRGTGFIARQLLSSLSDAGLLFPEIILRHQLLVDDRIPYTSHNSSASLKGKLLGSFDQLKDYCVEFLLNNSAEGSDAGLCITFADNIHHQALIQWGLAAKMKVLHYDDALKIATDSRVFMQGLTGEKTGIIGSLAAVGLHLSKNDGRVLWIKNLRETTGIFQINDFKKNFGVEYICDTSGRMVSDEAKLNVTDWTRPVMSNGLLTLYVEQCENKQYEYQTASKHFIKSVSEQNISPCC